MLKILGYCGSNFGLDFAFALSSFKKNAFNRKSSIQNKTNSEHGQRIMCLTEDLMNQLCINSEKYVTRCKCFL